MNDTEADRHAPPFRRRVLAAVVAGLLLVGVVSAWARSDDDTGGSPEGRIAAALASADTTTTAPPTTMTDEATTTTTVPPTTTTTTAPTTTTSTAPPRLISAPGYSPYATAGPVTLHHPADEVELVGFHESGHDGSQAQEPSPGIARWVTLETRDRGTGAHSAADIVVEPGREIRSPVTGTVKRAGSYILYCDHTDDYAVIEPDARPGWEVKIFHIDGVAVSAGQRVVAGETFLAPTARILPFESQVDERTSEPSWPHVHVEVIDPSIPDRPTGPGC